MRIERDLFLLRFLDTQSILKRQLTLTACNSKSSVIVTRITNRISVFLLTERLVLIF